MPAPQRHRFLARPPWLGGTLQTLRAVQWPVRTPLPPGHRMWLRLPDGDALVAWLHWPLRRAAGDRTVGANGRPLALLVHGLTGGPDDPYLRDMAAALLRRGFPVLRLGLRGGLASRPRSSSHYHLGRAEDLRDALRDLPPGVAGPGVLAVGWSLGGSLVLHLLARYAGEGGGTPPLLGGAAICPPLDPAAAHAAIDAHPLFGPTLLSLYRREVLAVTGAEDLTDRLRVAARRARSLREFEATVTAPRFGFASYDEYVARARPDRALPGLRTPTLLLMAEDDPIVPAHSIWNVDWSACPCVAPVLSTGGGHCGFRDLRGWDGLAERAVGAFFDGLASDAARVPQGRQDVIAEAAASQGDGSVPSSIAQHAASAAPT